MTVNGSSETGNCTDITVNLCNDPSSSVLFDGIIPKLIGLDGDMWASQLLTIRSELGSISLSFSFSGTQNFVGLKRVEIVLFNCPEWGISVKSITLWSISDVGHINPTVTSCDSLVRACIGNLNTNHAQTDFNLRFTSINSNDWVHIAEMEFYGANPNCSNDVIATTPTAGDVTTSTLPASNSSSITETSITSTPMDSNARAIIGGVIGVILVLITITVVVIIIIICFIRLNGKKGLTNFQNSFKHKLGPKTNKSVEMDILARYNPNSLKSSSKHNEDDLYNQLDGVGRRLPPNTQPANKDDTEEFSSVDLSDHEFSSASETGSFSNQLYAEVEDKPKCHKPPQRSTEHQPKPPQPPSQQSVEQMYSVIDKSKRCKPPQQSVQQEVEPPQQSVEQMYSVVDKSKQRKPSWQSVQQEVDPPQPPQQSVEQMYAVVDKSKRTKPQYPLLKS